MTCARLPIPSGRDDHRAIQQPDPRCPSKNERRCAKRSVAIGPIGPIGHRKIRPVGSGRSWSLITTSSALFVDIVCETRTGAKYPGVKGKIVLVSLPESGIPNRCYRVATPARIDKQTCKILKG